MEVWHHMVPSQHRAALLLELRSKPSTGQLCQYILYGSVNTLVMSFMGTSSLGGGWTIRPGHVRPPGLSLQEHSSLPQRHRGDEEPHSVIGR
ncbi:unnamed protein product [Arctogadus glacialis]